MHARAQTGAMDNLIQTYVKLIIIITIIIIIIITIITKYYYYDIIMSVHRPVPWII